MSTRALHPSTDTRLRGVELRSVLLVQYGFGCCWCGHALAATDPDYSTEHLIPKARGGPERVLENLAPAHLECNEERGYLPVSEWVFLCGRRGRRPNRPAITSALKELAELAPTERARQYAARELQWMERDNQEREAA